MTIGQKQELFSRLLILLLQKAHELGYEVRLRELWRTDEQAALYAAQGKGIKNSLHRIGLAIDLVLMSQGRVLSTTQWYRALGEYWESLHELCSWGGDFGDGGHFSITHNGVR
jgi:hypothetical protein